MSLREFGAVWPMYQRNVSVDRRRPMQLFDDLELSACVVEMVRTAYHVGNAHIVVVYNHSQHVRGRSIASQQNHVVELVVSKPDIAQHHISHDCLAGLA